MHMPAMVIVFVGMDRAIGVDMQMGVSPAARLGAIGPHQTPD